MFSEMTRKRRVVLLTGMVAIFLIMVIMLVLLVWQGQATKSRINDLNDLREAAFLEVEEGWGIAQRGERKMPVDVTGNELYGQIMINGEQEEIATTYYSLIEKAGSKFVVFASLVLAAGIGLMFIVIITEIALLAKPALQMETKSDEEQD